MPPGASLVSAIFAWLHLLTAGVAAGLLIAEYWMTRRMPDRLQVRLLGMVDLGYVLALIGSFATGLARLWYFGQEPAVYFSNRLFWLKIALYGAIGIAAVAGARQTLRWNREARSAPAFAPLSRDVERLRASLALALGLWLILPLISVLIARGFGSPAA